MKLKTVLIILSVLVIIFLLVKGCTSLLKKEINGSVEKLKSGRKSAFLKDVDLSEEGYALILDDKKPYVLIDDGEVLKTNQDKIKLKISWMNYLPGEGGGYRGLRVYRFNKLIDAKLARSFKTFEIGDLRKHGRPVELKSIYETKAVYDRMRDSLNDRSDIFIARTTETNSDGYEYRFTLNCPSILVVQNDSTFNKTDFGYDFAKRIVESLSSYTGFSAENSASSSTQIPPLLVLKKNGTTYYLRNDETNNTLPLEGYELYGNQLLFRCTKAFYEQVKTHDFSNSFIRKGLAEDEIKMLIQDKIGPDNGEITKDAVYESMFSSDFTVGKLYEQKYELRYFELVDAN